MWYINILSFKEAEKGENSKMAAVRNAKASFRSHARQISLLRNSRANTPALFAIPFKRHWHSFFLML